MSSRISSTFHTVVLGPSFTGLGYLPHRTPAHQLLLEIGTTGKIGGLAFELPIIPLIRTKPVSGNVIVLFFIDPPCTFGLINFVVIFNLPSVSLQLLDVLEI
jgi:hypothetical protein